MSACDVEDAKDLAADDLRGIVEDDLARDWAGEHPREAAILERAEDYPYRLKWAAVAPLVADRARYVRRNLVDALAAHREAADLASDPYSYYGCRRSDF